MSPRKSVCFSSARLIDFKADLLLDILELHTPIIILDRAKPSAKQDLPKTIDQLPEYALKEFPSTLFNELNEAEVVEFSSKNSYYKNPTQDPLSNEYFKSIHGKPERLEKGIRNTDKNRAQHEKDTVIRLLEGLQGHDWLKVLGVSGITDTRKKDYEPARAHFIKGCGAILEKFRTWREEEKRRKLEKEQAVAEAEEDEEEGDDEDSGNISDGDPPDYSDSDASAARQLHEEARSAPLHDTRSDKRANHRVGPEPSYQLEKDFTSFFSKKHLRDAAIAKNRRSTRSAVAWGHPVPDVPEADFDLPLDYRDEEIIKANARRRRRDRRVNKD
jgi:hypothetical protein